MNQRAAGQPSISQIRSRHVSVCPVCGDAGEVLYGGLRDGLFGAPGRWSLKQCSRAECGLAWLDPMPLEEDIHLAYVGYHTHQAYLAPPESWLRRVYRAVKQGYLAQRYGYKAKCWQEAAGRLMYLFPRRRAIVDAQAFYLPAKEQGRLLDVGCGNGQILDRMAAQGWKAEGIDSDPIAVQLATAKGLRVHQGTLEAQQFGAECFDAVVMNHVIEHVHDPLSLLKHCHRILKLDGRLVVITPNIRSWGHRVYKHAWRGLEPPRHLQIFSRRSLSAISMQAGFGRCDCRAITRAAKSILLASETLRKKETPAHPSRGSRAKAEFMSLAEWAGASLDGDAGEELVLVAQK